MANAILQQWGNIVAFIDSQAYLTVGDLSAPVGLLVPGGAGLEMDLAQLLNYLTRSEGSLYPGDINQGINNLFNNELGRPASSTDYSNWVNVLYDTGSDMGLREDLATSPEAESDLNTSFENILSRPIDSDNLAGAQAGLDTGFFTQASFRSYLSTTQEAADDLNINFQNILGRPIDTGEPCFGRGRTWFRSLHNDQLADLAC